MLLKIEINYFPIKFIHLEKLVIILNNYINKKCQT